MKKLAVLILLVCELALGGCGSTSSTSAAATTSGLWGAVLAGGSGEASGAVLGFITNFTVNGDGSLTVSQFSFNNNTNATGSCFVSATETGTSSLTTDSAGTVTGTITYVVTSTSPAGNTLTLTGTEDGSTITGNWTLTGSTGCSDTGGTFTMTKS